MSLHLKYQVAPKCIHQTLKMWKLETPHKKDKKSKQQVLLINPLISSLMVTVIQFTIHSDWCVCICLNCISTIRETWDCDGMKLGESETTPNQQAYEITVGHTVTLYDSYTVTV